MHLKRSLSLVGVVGATAAILIAAAGAAPGPAKPQPKLHFTTAASVLTYLKSHGINTRGIVVQRGARIYAGRKCPGKAWKCTRANRVIQFATLAASYSCSSDSCSVVQVTPPGTDNNAKCVQQTSAPGASQSCSITQTNVSGKNNATVFQLINQRSGQTQEGHQNALVLQTNGTGSNNSLVTQTIWQTTSTNNSLVPVNQDQNGTQSNDIDQNAVSGTQLSVMSQATLQKATAGREHSDDDDDHPHYTYPGPSPFTGSQNQYGDGRSHTDQNSTGVSKSYNFQNMLQIEKAPEYSAVTQSQVGPYRCCTSPGQTGNPNDVFQLQQAKLQFRSYGFSGTVGNQFIDENGTLKSSGKSHVSQYANQNGTTQSNSCDATAGGCAAEIVIDNGDPATCSVSTDADQTPFCNLTDSGPSLLTASNK